MGAILDFVEKRLHKILRPAGYHYEQDMPTMSSS